MDKTVEQFIDLARGHFGDRLRALRQYDGEGGRLLYRRDDIDGYDAEAEEQIHELARLDTREFTEDLWHFSAGKFRGSVRFLSHTNLINLPTGPEQGFIVSVDRGIDSKLERFGDDARSWLAASDLWEFDDGR